MKRIVLFLIALCVFLGTAFFGGRDYITASILCVCLVVMFYAVRKKR